MMDVEVEIPAVFVVFADQAGIIGFIDCALESFAFANVFATEINIAGKVVWFSRKVG